MAFEVSSDPLALITSITVSIRSRLPLTSVVGHEVDRPAQIAILRDYYGRAGAPRPLAAATPAHHQPLLPVQPVGLLVVDPDGLAGQQQPQPGGRRSGGPRRPAASLIPYFRDTEAANSPAVCSFSTLSICSSINLSLGSSVTQRNGLCLKSGHLRGTSQTLPANVASMIIFKAAERKTTSPRPHKTAGVYWKSQNL